MLEKFLKIKLYDAMVGEGNSENDSVAMNKKSVDDTDFMGRDDRDLPVETRIQTIMQSLTLEEKIRLLGGYKQLAVQPIPRLNLPSIWCSDATSGLRCFPGGTAFPAGVVLAATWDPDLIEKVGKAIGEEFRAVGVSVLLGPGVNIYRVPTCGRNFEYMGEDPHLAGKISAAYIRGAQSAGVITTIKHFACNNSDYDRHKTDSVLSERVLREIYLPAFRMAVQEGGSLGLMSAYNPVNGVYASENKHLLTEILREEWGFEGFVISDWDSVYSTVNAVKNGLNLEMPSGKWVSEKKVKKAIAQGQLTEADIEKMLLPLLTTLFKFGVYDRPQIDVQARLHPEEFIQLASETAQNGVVLLKNKGSLLPLTVDQPLKLVVMGRTVHKTPTGGGGSSYVHRPEALGIFEAVQKEFSQARIDVIPFRKNTLSTEEENLIKQADAVIFGAGFFTYEETECLDRAWVLPERQGELIQRVAQLNSKTVVILSSGGGVETQSWIHKIQACLHAFYLGETGGTVIAKILSGELNPGGKLPFTMAKHWEDFASTANYVKKPDAVKIKNVMVGQGNPKIRKVWKMYYKEGLSIGYRHFDTAKIDPQFPFGFGLSYTRFELSDCNITEQAGLPVVSLTVTNVGNRSGSEVLQCYVHDRESSVYRPEKELKAFRKVHLNPGESTQVMFSLVKADFQFFDETAQQWISESGWFDLFIGTSSKNTPFVLPFELKQP